MAESLQVLAEDGDRQVFYLTAQDHDAAAWASGERRVQRIDLAVVRGLAATAGDRSAYEIAPRRWFRIPRARAPRSTLLRWACRPCRRGDPSARSTCSTCCETNSRCYTVSRRTESKASAGSHRFAPRARPRHCSPRTAANRVDAQASIAEAWLSAWRIGRGRPLERADLDQAPVTDTFAERMAALVEDTGR